MPFDGPDRRHAIRRVPHHGDTLARVRLRTGRELTVVNVSSAGALVEGITRLLPGTHSDVHVVTRQGRVLVRTRVVRAMVWYLEADVVRYRAALAFDVPVDTESDGYAVPPQPVAPETDSGRSYPERSSLTST
jgi:hypothetical protein